MPGQKQRKMILEDLRDQRFRTPGADFQVKKLVNTVQWEIGQYLSFSQAEKINLHQDMTLEIIKYGGPK